MISIIISIVFRKISNVRYVRSLALTIMLFTYAHFIHTYIR